MHQNRVMDKPTIGNMEPERAETFDKEAGSSNIQMKNLSHSTSTRNRSNFDILPTEMYQAVLEKLPTVELFKCRQINRQWNQISSEMIRERKDVELEFGFNEGQFVQIFQHRRCEKMLVDICKPHYKYGSKRLADLVACMSPNFPYTNFHFDDLQRFENDEDIKNFLSIWGKSIRALKVNMTDPIKSVGILRQLIFDKVTNLKKLELQFCQGASHWEISARKPSSIRIVDDDSIESQLPNLEVFYVNHYYTKFRGVVENILAAACNLKLFEVCIESKINPYFGADCVHDDRIVMEEESVTSADLEMLKTFNKLHCLKKLKLFVTEDLIAYWEKSKDNIDNLKPQSLAFALKSSIWKNEQLKQSATSLINHLFHTSKDVLRTLSIEPLALLGPELVIPKLENLKKLDMGGFSQRETPPNVTMFPTLFEMADRFPNLKELDMHIYRDYDFFPSSESLKTMAGLEVLRVYGGMAGGCKEKVMRATPNVTTLLLVENKFCWDENVSIDFQNISNNLPKLESFGWLMCRSVYKKLLYILDAAITGLPGKFCKELSKKFRNKDHLSADEVASYEVRRERASILDLKALKKLDVTLFFDFDDYCDKVSSECNSSDEAGFEVGSDFHETGFTKVSKFLAFALMPDLKVRTHKRLE